MSQKPCFSDSTTELLSHLVISPTTNVQDYNTTYITVFCQGRDFATFSLKESKCRIQNCLGEPFVAYEFAWGRILNKCAVISPDKQGVRLFVIDS